MSKINPTEKFQFVVIDAINKAAANDVHPAIVYTVLAGMAGDVLASIKKTNAQPHPGNPPSPKPTTPPENVEPLRQPDAA